MSRKKYNIMNLAGMVCLLVLMASCKKYTEIGPPPNYVLGADVFTDSLSSTDAVLGIYTTLNSTGIISDNETAYTGLSSDELNKINADNDQLQLVTNQLASTNSHTADLWSSAYQVIAQANACIAGLATSKAISPGLKKQLTSEAEFMRAFSYFYLVNLYGDVPLVLTTNYQQESTMARTPSAQVYQQIISDLQDATTSLPVSYASGQHVRATKWAATALTARVDLYLKNWAGAQAMATSVINNSGTSLEPNLNNVFLIQSAEAIWQVQPPTYYINAIDFDVMFGYGASYHLTNSLFDAFEPGDQRKAAWIDSTVNPGQPTIYYPYKYKADAYSGNRTEYTVALRLAEQYLIRAEAFANQNNIPGAVGDLNTIRNRAGLPSLSTSLTAAQFAAAIEQERRIELFAEWGHRWLDLKRLPSLTVAGDTRADDVLGVLKAPNWQPSDQLYPIPYQDTKLNPNLTQNPGY